MISVATCPAGQRSVTSDAVRSSSATSRRICSASVERVALTHLESVIPSATLFTRMEYDVSPSNPVTV